MHNWTLALPVVGLGLLAACAVNPATGEREFTLMSEAQEIAIGQEMDGQIIAEMGLYDDPDLQEYVSGIGLRLAQASERPNLPWKFTVVDSPVVNAFALPGGFIYLTRGILPFLGDEAEMVGVVGHEIGHVTARHSAQQYSRATGAQLGLLLGSVFVPAVERFGGLAQTGLGLLFLRYGRDDELQADSLGTRYSARGGWDPAGVAGMLSTLDRLGDASENRQGIPNWLASHPPPEDRVERVQAAIEVARAEFPDSTRADRDGFLRRVDGLVYGENPEQGILRGREFFHTSLRFVLRFPEGWAVNNSATQVVAKQPDANAFLLLQLVERPEGGDIRNVALTTMRESGFEAVRGDRSTVNGLRAFVGTYQGSIEGLGPVTMQAAHVEHGGRVFLIAGLAPVEIFARSERAISSSVQSFRSLSASQAEAIRPNRIDLYTARTGDTWEALVERNANGAISPATLAAMNGATLREQPQPGQRLKIVVVG